MNTGEYNILHQYAGFYTYRFPILAAAFDTIDSNILITRIPSWFGIRDPVLNWF